MNINMNINININTNINTNININMNTNIYIPLFTTKKKINTYFGLNSRHLS